MIREQADFTDSFRDTKIIHINKSKPNIECLMLSLEGCGNLLVSFLPLKIIPIIEMCY